MTLTAPKSRQGKFVLVLAFLAAAVVVIGGLAWAGTARADLPTTVAELDQNPDSGGTVAPGATVTYVASATLTGGAIPATSGIGIELNIDADLINISVVCADPGAASSIADSTGPEVGCHFDNGAVFPDGLYSATVTAIVGAASGTISAPTDVEVCDDSNDNIDCDDESGADLQAFADVNPADVGTLTIDAASLVTVPATATNFPGTSHTVRFILEPNVDCASGEVANANNGQADISCDATDVNLTCDNGTGTLVSVVVGSTSTTTQSTVDVTIVSDGTDVDSCAVSLNLASGVNNGTPDDNVFFTSPDATKIYSADGELRHRDPADAASEDAATGAAPKIPNNTDPYCATWGDPCGLLSAQHDGDDATGSYHEACIIGSALTHSGNFGQITWNITTVAGTPTVFPTPPTEFAGPNDEPCVRWGSNNPGSQQITATFDPDGAGGVPEWIIYWDNDTNAPLIKEWNDLDPTLLINVDGDVGDTLAANSDDLANWAARNCEDAVGFCGLTDRDGTTITQTGVVIAGPVQKGFIDAAGVSFIDYAMGSHSSGPSDAYDGPVDGAAQTYTVSGLCGSVRLEDPTTGVAKIVLPGASADVLSSDKGVGFQIVPNDDGAIETTPGNADCLPGAEVCVTIATEEANDFGSPPLDAVDDEEICVIFVGGELGSKHPDLAWAGQRKSLDADWSVLTIVGGDEVRVCPWGNNEQFTVRYVQHAGSPGALTDDLGAGTALGQDFMEVLVQVDPDFDADGNILPNTGCHSSVLYETEGEGQVDVSAFVVDDCCTLQGRTAAGGSVLSDEIDFLIFYMKFYDITMDPDTAQNVNVSLGTEVTATVRGWTVTNSSNCAQLPAEGDLPAGRCVFPDDWVYLATGQRGATSVPVVTVDRPEWDLWGGSTSPCTDTTSAGPLSQLDSDGCGTGSAPHVSQANRDAIFANGLITKDDAPMPVALVKFELVGDNTNGVVCADNPAVAVEGCSGFITEVDSTAAQFDQTHIPAESWIPPTTAGFPPQGYSWNTWGPAGQPNTGLYDFWEAAQSGAEVISCGGANTPCNDSAPTGGYKWIAVYSDNHGVAKATVFGDADLDFDGCTSSGPLAAAKIVFIDGQYCQPGDEVGNASIVARADYPDKRKHPQIRSGEVDFTFTWAGIKEISIVPGLTSQFNYVVFHVTDRDGYCGQEPSNHSNLHTVLGEQVTFLIESSEGIIFPNENGDAVAQLGSWTTKTADVVTFQASDTALAPAFNAPIAAGGISVLPLIQTDPDECQAWIHVSSSLIDEVDVLIQAFDPEGTVTFDTIINEVTPTPPPATPSPTPANQQNLWADIDCDSSVNPVDSLKILRADAGLSVPQSASCPAPSADLNVQWDGHSTNEKWGDADCSGSLDPVDSLKVLRFDAGLFYIQQEPCPDIGAEVLIPQQ